MNQITLTVSKQEIIWGTNNITGPSSLLGYMLLTGCVVFILPVQHLYSLLSLMMSIWLISVAVPNSTLESGMATKVGWLFLEKAYLTPQSYKH